MKYNVTSIIYKYTSDRSKVSTLDANCKNFEYSK